jgi:aryl-alcohol dehydrogenase-like predicted oxidoreductase
MVWSPLAGGLLSGKYDREGSGPQGIAETNTAV